MAEALCYNMADEVNGLLFSCNLSPFARRALTGMSSVHVRIGVPHVPTAIEQVADDGFLEAVLPEGVETHEVEHTGATQVFFDELPTVAPTTPGHISPGGTQVFFDELPWTGQEEVPTVAPTTPGHISPGATQVFFDELPWTGQEEVPTVAPTTPLTTIELDEVSGISKNDASGMLNSSTVAIIALSLALAIALACAAFFAQRANVGAVRNEKRTPFSSTSGSGDVIVTVDDFQRLEE